MILQGYNFKIECIKTEDFGYADILSRIINQDSKQDDGYVIFSIIIESDVLQILTTGIEALPVTYNMTFEETSNDTILKVVTYFDILLRYLIKLFQ